MSTVIMLLHGIGIAHLLGIRMQDPVHSPPLLTPLRRPPMLVPELARASHACSFRFAGLQDNVYANLIHGCLGKTHRSTYALLHSCRYTTRPLLRPQVPIPEARFGRFLHTLRPKPVATLPVGFVALLGWRLLNASYCVLFLRWCRMQSQATDPCHVGHDRRLSSLLSSIGFNSAFPSVGWTCRNVLMPRSSLAKFSELPSFSFRVLVAGL